jgi:hypothetical protein
VRCVRAPRVTGIGADRATATSIVDASQGPVATALRKSYTKSLDGARIFSAMSPGH